MQPACSIPPLTEDGVKMLVGLKCFVPRQRTGSNRRGRWMVTIKQAWLITHNDCLVECEGGHGFGKPKRFALDAVKFTNHTDDPTKKAIARARWQAKIEEGKAK